MRIRTPIYCTICCCVSLIVLALTLWFDNADEAQAQACPGTCIPYRVASCTNNGCAVVCDGGYALIPPQVTSGQTSGAYPEEINFGLCYATL